MESSEDLVNSERRNSIQGTTGLIQLDKISPEWDHNFWSSQPDYRVLNSFEVSGEILSKLKQNYCCVLNSFEALSHLEIISFEFKNP